MLSRRVALIALALAALHPGAALADGSRTHLHSELREFWTQIERSTSVPEIRERVREDWGGFPVVFKGPTPSGNFAEVRVTGVGLSRMKISTLDTEFVALYYEVVSPISSTGEHIVFQRSR